MLLGVANLPGQRLQLLFHLVQPAGHLRLQRGNLILNGGLKPGKWVVCGCVYVRWAFYR